MNRRDFIATSGLIALAQGVSTKAGANELSMKDRPNILVIMTDQQSADMMSCAGNSNLHTPAMDEIATAGVRFEKAYCTNPICVPSRTSFLTGTMPHENGINFNTSDESFEIHAEPLAKAVKESGYQTGYIGKWHVPHAIEDTDWHGFDFVAHNQPNGTDPRVTQGCDAFLSERTEAPFLLFASFVNPHDICEAARMLSGIEDRYKNGEIPPIPPLEDCPVLPYNAQPSSNEPEVIRQHQRDPRNRRTYPSVDWTESEWRQYRWIYARLTELVDQQIGKILEQLKVHGVADNTVVIFTSDHGDGNGAHQWNQKTLFYEESARVPFVIYDPRDKSAGKVNNEQLISMGLDLFPTIYDYAGISMPSHLRGISARPDSDHGTSNRPYIVAENDLHHTYGQSGGVYGRMIRSSRYKYTRFSQGKNPEQLFDLESDPGEMNNLVGESAYSEQLNQHRNWLDQYIEKTEDFFPL